MNPPHLLLIDDDRNIVQALSIRLGAAGYEITSARDGASGLAKAVSELPDAIILDIRMPVMDGLAVLSKLRENDNTRDIPVLVLTANVAETVRSKALDLGARRFLEKPCDPNELLQAVQAAVGPAHRREDGVAPTTEAQAVDIQKTILFADDDPAFLRALTRRCEALGVEVKTAANGLEALVMLRQMVTAGEAPDLLILDNDMPGAGGLNVCEKLGHNAMTSGIPIVLLTGRSDAETRRYCKFLGARYLHKNTDFWAKLSPMICKLLDLEPARTDRPDEKTEKRDVTPQVARADVTPTILVIDDDPQINKAFTIRLGALGIEVITAPNAEQGVVLAKLERPDLIISDINLPNMTGDHLLVVLQSDVDTQDIPVIIITGQTLDGRVDYALKREILGRRGAVAYFAKPVDFNALLDVLKNHIPIPVSRTGNSASVAR